MSSADSSVSLYPQQTVGYQGQQSTDTLALCRLQLLRQNPTDCAGHLVEHMYLSDPDEKKEEGG